MNIMGKDSGMQQLFMPKQRVKKTMKGGINGEKITKKCVFLASYFRLANGEIRITKLFTICTMAGRSPTLQQVRRFAFTRP